MHDFLVEQGFSEVEADQYIRVTCARNDAISDVAA
jgi:hypothetical protein